MRDDAFDYWSNLGLRADCSEFGRACDRAQSMALAIRGVTDLGFLKVYKNTIGQAIRKGHSAGCARKALDRAFGKGSDACDGQAAEQAEVSKQAAEEYEHLMHDHRHLDEVIRTSLNRARFAGLRRKRLMEAAVSGSMPYALYEVADKIKEGNHSNGACRDGEDNKKELKKGACAFHKFLHGLLLPLDYEQWIDFWPPNCLSCDCAVKILEKSEVSDKGLEQTPANKIPNKYKLGDRSFRSGFSSAEHPALPHADSLADELKSNSLSFPDRHQKAVKWYISRKNCEAYRERYLLGLKAFGTLDTSTAPRGEMSINLAVLSNNAPDRLVGHVATVTDAGYQHVLKELVDKLDLDQNMLNRIAIEILKELPSKMSNTPSITPNRVGFDVSVADGQVCICFEHTTENEWQFFQMKEVSSVSEAPQKILSWYQSKPSSRTVTVG